MTNLLYSARASDHGARAAAHTLTLVALALSTALSLAGFLFPSQVYPEATRDALLPNDLVNLLVGLPLLAWLPWQARRGSWPALLGWPGALLFVVYNYCAYPFAMPFGLLTGLYLAPLLVGAWGMAAWLRSVDRSAVASTLSGHVGERSAGWVLTLFGALFAVRAVAMLPEAGAGVDQGVLAADLLVSILWVGGGILLLRRRDLGYVVGLGLLLGASALFAGLILFLLLQPVLTGAPFSLVDVVVVAVMALICWVPGIRFALGVRRRGGMGPTGLGAG